MCLFLNIDKKDFVKLNFMGKMLQLLTKKVVDLYGEDVCNFVWESLDLIYSTDVIIYGSDNELLPDKCNVRSRVDDRIMNASSNNQMKTINNLDELLYLEMVNKFYDLNKFIPYIISNEKERKHDHQRVKSMVEISFLHPKEVEANPKRFIMTNAFKPVRRIMEEKNLYIYDKQLSRLSNILIEIPKEISPKF